MSDHFTDPSVRKRIDVDLALLERYDDLLTDLELTIVRAAKRQDGEACHRLRSVPGIGTVLALTILYDLTRAASGPRSQRSRRTRAPQSAPRCRS